MSSIPGQGTKIPHAMQHGQKKKKKRERGWSLLIKEKGITKQTTKNNKYSAHAHTLLTPLCYSGSFSGITSPSPCFLSSILENHWGLPAMEGDDGPLGRETRGPKGPSWFLPWAGRFSSEILIMVKRLLAWLGSLLGSQICVARNAQPSSSLAEALKHTLTVSERAFHESFHLPTHWPLPRPAGKLHPDLEAFLNQTRSGSQGLIHSKLSYLPTGVQISSSLHSPDVTVELWP